MPNVMGVLRTEIRRLARKETKEAVRDLKRQVTALRRRLAQANKRMSAMERIARKAGTARGVAPVRTADGEEGAARIRFSPKWVKTHRAKLGMSRRVYAKLVGVSPQTILLWESGKARPRRAALASWRAVRGKGIRELKATAGEGEGGSAKRGRAARGGKAARGKKGARGGKRAGARAARASARGGAPAPRRGRIARAARRARPKKK